MHFVNARIRNSKSMSNEQYEQLSKESKIRNEDALNWKIFQMEFQW